MKWKAAELQVDKENVEKMLQKKEKKQKKNPKSFVYLYLPIHLYNTLNLIIYRNAKKDDKINKKFNKIIL